MEIFPLLLWLIFMFNSRVLGQNHEPYYCKEERCGKNGPQIRFPFRLNTTLQPTHCGHPGFSLFCIGSQTALGIPTAISKTIHLVKKIDYKAQEIEVHVDRRSSDFLPYHVPELLLSKFSGNKSEISLSSDFPFEFSYNTRGKNSTYRLLNCSDEMIVPPYNLLLVPSGEVIDIVDEKFWSGFIFSCSMMLDFDSFPEEIYELFNSYSYLTNGKLLLGWSKPDCRLCEAKQNLCKLKNVNETEAQCFEKRKGKSKISLVIYSTTFKIVASLFSGFVVIATTFYIYVLHEKEKQKQKRIKEFLEDYLALKPSRYTYADIKKITSNLKDKLGQGAFGTVFKGKLSNEVHVAVKILNESKGNGEEFINEVATIGQIHHVNVVRLIGYCAEGFRRALVYEFLPNGSLEKYILPLECGIIHRLNWETLREIAHGIAKGIEYLHQGCDQRILHFDIKPQNVLLDQNFTPKISDFGLAKLCSKNQSAVSMNTARGTLGYIAPEVLTRNLFGNVSYKSDVYSFGMLLLEMVGGRKSTNAINDSKNHEIYYPEWIYNLLEQGEDFRIDIEREGDAKIAKKLAIVGLWCIQWHPIGRPTMKVVVQMLEDGREVLPMPPNPFATTNSSRTNDKSPARLRALAVIISEEK